MFLWLMVALKVPLAALLWLVWWASRPPEGAEPEQRDWRRAAPAPPPAPVAARARRAAARTRSPEPCRPKRVRARGAPPRPLGTELSGAGPRSVPG